MPGQGGEESRRAGPPGQILVVLAILAGLVSTATGCRKFLTDHKMTVFRKLRTAGIEWQILNRDSLPEHYTRTMERILASAGLELVDASSRTPDLLVHVELRGYHTYAYPPPRWKGWDSGEVILTGPGGKIYFRHFYGEKDEPLENFYTEGAFYEEFLLMISRIWGRGVAESEVRTMAGDPRFADVPLRVLAKLDRERDWSRGGRFAGPGPKGP